MKKFLFFITLFTIFNLQSEDKLLKCDGLYSSPELNQIIGGDKDAGDFVISRSTIKSFILFKFNEQKASASIKLPSLMQPYARKKRTLNEFIKIDNISIDENIINGSFKYPRKAIKGKVMLDRNLGNIVYSHYNDEFRGDCSIFMKSTKKF
jgi:hypothetical protein